jgi:sucrose-6-phosphate hydrolase SacC (GH32 family)
MQAVAAMIADGNRANAIDDIRDHSAADKVNGQRTPKRLRASTLKPNIHLTAPYWINDPCAPGYDVRRKKYHVFYQSTRLTASP